MVAFWGLTLVVAYGCFHGGGLVTVLGGWMGDSDRVLVEPFPLLRVLKISTIIALALVGASALAIFVWLNRPRVADTLIETELELHKVTWPTWGEAWAGTMAVTGMVVVLFLFLTGADLLLSQLMLYVMGSVS